MRELTGGLAAQQTHAPHGLGGRKSDVGGGAGVVGGAIWAPWGGLSSRSSIEMVLGGRQSERASSFLERPFRPPHFSETLLRGS